MSEGRGSDTATMRMHWADNPGVGGGCLYTQKGIFYNSSGHLQSLTIISTLTNTSVEMEQGIHSTVSHTPGLQHTCQLLIVKIQKIEVRNLGDLIKI